MQKALKWIRSHWRLSLAIYAALVVLQLVLENDQWHFRYKVLQNMEAQYGALTIDRIPSTSISTLRRNLDDIPYLDTHPVSKSSKPPVILLHGTPGSSIGFNDLGPEFSNHQRRAIWFDLPGFAAMGGPRSRAFSDLSSKTYAEYVLAVMDELDIERAHIVGWSNGGAVALNMADTHPDRVASITLLAAVGAQETEGSGSHFFEHTKYALGGIFSVWLPRVVPPFALIPLDERESFIRNFSDTDQRPLADIMRKLATPTLILHGRDDFLTADWAAEYHHELMPTSTLVMTHHDHFMPFLAPKETAQHIENYIARFDDPNAIPVRETIDLAPRRTPFGGLGGSFLHWVHFGPWWVMVLFVAGASLVLRRIGQAWIVVLMGATELDVGVAWVGLTLAILISMIVRHTLTDWRAWVGSVLRPGVMLGAGFFLTQLAFRPLGLALGEVGWVLSVLIMALLIEINIRPLTRKGRLGLITQWKHLRHHEWWPTWALHLPSIPIFLAAAIKHRHPLVFTCCNPGIDQGGGFAGESKVDILRGLLHAGDETVLFGDLVETGPKHQIRAQKACDLIANEPRLGGFPIILKPNQGENGRGLKLCRNEADVHAYFERTPAGVILQKFHPGPHELGVFWVRDPHKDSGLEGRVFSICRKEFPELECDGKRTLGRLIDDHPRFRLQREVFRTRFADRLDDVPEAGTTIRLSPAGNHKQGAIFRDAPELLTPELEAEIDRVAAAFKGQNGGPIDFGRFDVRYESEESLRAGRGLAIIELNGVTSETINIYDPNLSVWFAWAILRKQWKVACDLGGWRKAQGVKPMGVFALLFGTRDHLKNRRSYASAS